MDAESGDAAPSLTVLETVRCLACGAVYAKPTGGGTVLDNTVVAYVTGLGLKTIEAVSSIVGPTHTIAPTLDAFNEAVGTDAEPTP